MTIWSNVRFVGEAARMLEEGTRPRRLVRADLTHASVLVPGSTDASFAEADVAFGQPDPADCLASPRLRWLEVSSAGYARYDTHEFRERFLGRGIAFTNASGVYTEPCAQHLLAMMLALGRQLPVSFESQMTDRSWKYDGVRDTSRLLNGQTVVMLGYGAIGRRLAELLAPFGMQLFAVRRQTRSEGAVRIVPEEDLTRVLALADHVVDILPESASTRHYVNARRMACFKPGARFYNVGRGATVDQPALLDALHSGRIGMAYLDVMEPEPLPPEHPLWSAPNCFITPHSAGGRHDQYEALANHFLSNLAAFEAGTPLQDRVI